jgi:hypothetical protein
MEKSFDLDINNYTVNELINFFKLENTFSINDLIEKEKELTSEILSSNNNFKFNSKYKFNLINFLKSAKDILTSYYYELETTDEINKNFERFNNPSTSKVGQILNPLAPHQALKETIISNEKINGYNYNTTTSNYAFNTTARNDFFLSTSSNSTYDLPIKWKNVISISLSSANIPNVMYCFNSENGTNQIFIEEDGTGLSGVVILPEGNYDSNSNNILLASFPDEFTKQLNEQILGITNPSLYRFFVTINLSNRKTVITNNTNTFTINTLKKTQQERCSIYSKNIYTDYGDNPPDKTKVPFLLYTQTMAYLMGFREIVYSNSMSYTSESIFTNIYSNYLYFVLEDFTGSQNISNTFGIVGTSGILENNILGIIPIDSNIFSTTFDNNSNFIYKKREYFGPVDISKISIKLLNQKGNLVNLHETDFNFCLQVKTIYNLTENTNIGLRSKGFF